LNVLGTAVYGPSPTTYPEQLKESTVGADEATVGTEIGSDALPVAR
jgi:hypothetical protein